MTNGGGAGMASFMTKKKKYKFQVEICLEELLEVPFVSAVLFAKLRLLDGGNFQDHSSRQEVRDHKVQWNSTFSFPCKMMANASTGVMERCVLRISIRKESKGGRSFNKLGFVDLNLAEYAGAGLIHKKALLEGYDARHRQDNSMLKFKIELNMISGDIVFKAPSPSLKHKQINVDDTNNEQRSDDFSSGSLAGSIASGSSGFGSLPKKRPALLSSDLVIGQTLSESNHIPVTIATDYDDPLSSQTDPSDHHHHQEAVVGEQGHSRNSSNTSQLSKASGYSSVHSRTHSRQSSSGDSGHVRDLHSRSVRTRQVSNAQSFFRTNTYPKKLNIPNTIPSTQEVFSTPEAVITSTSIKTILNNISAIDDDNTKYFTPKGFQKQTSYVSNSSTDDYKTPEGSLIATTTDIFSHNFELQKSSSTSVVDKMRNNMLTIDEIEHRKSDSVYYNIKHFTNGMSLDTSKTDGVLRSKSEFQIPEHFAKVSSSEANSMSLETLETNKTIEGILRSRSELQVPKHAVETSTNNKSKQIKREEGVLRSKSDFQIPKLPVMPPERSFANKLFKSDNIFSFLTPRPKRKNASSEQSSPRHSPTNLFRIPPSPIPKLKSLPETRTTSLSSLRSGYSGNEGLTVPFIDRNPSTSSLVLSETGSLDRAKAAYERRKKTQAQDSDSGGVSGRVEITRVNPDDLIEELLKNTNLEPPDDSAETSGLQLFIAKDGTAALGNHEVKSQMSTGVQVFKQVVMDDR